MPEVEIKRTNFFDGEFLKQGEFLDMDLYHVHMRRRLLFLLFDKSGVVQASPTDLTLVAAGAGQIRVKAGMAVGKRPDLAEAKEIVVRDDQVINLSPTLGAGDSGIVTVHYNEQQSDPSSEGGVLGNKRILEQAIITVHKTPPGPPGPNASNGEPFVRLGTVDFNTLNTSGPRDVAFLQASLLAATPSISVSPNIVVAGTTPTLAVTSSGGLSLSTLNAGQVTVTGTGITVTGVSGQTANTANVDLNVTAGATAGARTITILGASTTLTVQAGQTVTGVQGVDQPGGDLLFKVDGSGFTAPMTLQFSSTAGPGSFTATVLATTVNANQGLFPLAQIQALTDRTRGPIRVVSGGPPLSLNDVDPPAEFLTIPSPSIARNNIANITGRCFFGTPPAGAAIIVRLVNAVGTVVLTWTQPSFPDALLGETLSPTAISVFLPNTLAPGTYRFRVQTRGGTVESGPFSVTIV